MGILEDLSLFELNLNELIIKYEQYFLGLEKREPLQLLNEVERFARKYQVTQISNTMQKFKYNSIVARLGSYKQYWTRINRLIEEGKYSRDKFKMEMHQRKDSKNQPAKELEKEQRINPELQMLYQQFIDARKTCHLPVNSITPEMVAAAIEKQKPAILSKYNCDRVEYAVVVEKGTPKIKVRPKL
jgi:leucyl aminopeptidase